MLCIFQSSCRLYDKDAHMVTKIKSKTFALINSSKERNFMFPEGIIYNNHVFESPSEFDFELLIAELNSLN